jgi:hypothetical protein
LKSRFPDARPLSERSAPPRPLDLRQDVPLLDAMITRPDCRLVIVDPLSAYLGRGVETLKAEVRRVMAALADWPRGVSWPSSRSITCASHRVWLFVNSMNWMRLAPRRNQTRHCDCDRDEGGRLGDGDEIIDKYAVRSVREYHPQHELAPIIESRPHASLRDALRNPTFIQEVRGLHGP